MFRIYDSSTNEWSTPPGDHRIITHRFGQSAVFLPKIGRVYVCGCFLCDGIYNDCVWTATDQVGMKQGWHKIETHGGTVDHVKVGTTSGHRAIVHKVELFV